MYKRQQYVYSKSIDDAGLGGSASGLVAQNWLNLSGERGLSPFDQRHVVTLTAQYSTGVGVHGGTLMSGWRGAIFKGWTVVTNVNAATGLPMSPIYGVPVPDTTNLNQRPEYTGAALYDAPGGRFLNPLAYEAPVTGQWGNAGRNTITGPGQFSFNANMARTFASKLDLTISSTNPLNHVVITGWYNTVTSSQFGLPSAANGMRSLQVQMRWRF